MKQKILTFLDRLAVSLSKPVDYFAEILSRDNCTLGQLLLQLLVAILILPLLVILGVLSVIITAIRVILGGDKQ